MGNPFTDLSDERLMELYQQGDYMAFEVIYNRYQKNVYSYLCKRLKNDENINDVFQNIFIKFHKFKNNYNSEYPLLKWIFTISKSELLDYLKKNQGIAYTELKDEYANPVEDKAIEGIEIDSEKSLTSTEKEALKLRYYSDEDFLEISKKLKTSQTNVRKIVSRGIQKLRLKYKGGLK